MSATGNRPAAVQRALGPRIPRPPRPRADSHRRQANRAPTSRILSIFPTSTGSKRATGTSPAILTTSSSRRPSWSHTGLPEPEFFAYPLSTHSDYPENRTVASMFQAAMLDDVNLRATTSRDLAQRKLSRMDVVANLSLQEWGARLMTMSPLDPATAQPFSRNCAWTTRDLTASYPLPGETINLRRWTLVQKDHDAVLLAPYQTTMWQNYTVTADLGGFTHPGNGTTAGLVALAGAPRYQVEVTIRIGAYQVHQAFDNPRVVASGTLPQQRSHKVDIAVRPDLVTVLIDGRPTLRPPHTAARPAPPSGRDFRQRHPTLPRQSSTTVRESHSSLTLITKSVGREGHDRTRTPSSGALIRRAQRVYRRTAAPHCHHALRHHHPHAVADIPRPRRSLPHSDRRGSPRSRRTHPADPGP